MRRTGQAKVSTISRWFFGGETGGLPLPYVIVQQQDLIQIQK
jgi:hypothetical protein